MNVLLVYPEFPETFWSFKHALKFLGKRAAQPPLGLMTVAALLPASWKKRLVDTNVERLRDRDLKWADAVFVSAMHIQRDSLVEIVERCHARGLRTVVGGPIASSVPAAELKADHVVIGEAESLIGELARELEAGTARPLYQAAERPEMAESPLPDLNLIKMRRYSTMTVQYSRGCPFNCEFCDIIEIYGRRPRTKAVAQVLAELDQLLTAGWRETIRRSGAGSSRACRLIFTAVSFSWCLGGVFFGCHSGRNGRRVPLAIWADGNAESLSRTRTRRSHWRTYRLQSRLRLADCLGYGLLCRHLTSHSRKAARLLPATCKKKARSLSQISPRPNLLRNGAIMYSALLRISENRLYPRSLRHVCSERCSRGIGTQLVGRS